MDFKKPNRHDKREAKSSSEHSVSVPRNPRQESTAKTTHISQIRQFLVTKKIIALSIGIVALISSFAVDALIRHQSAMDNSDTNTSNTLIENVEYQTLLPSDKSISELGGWKRISPEDKDPVFAYVDTIDGVSVSVSQQPLPQSFISHTDSQVAELAKKFNATTEIDAGGTKVYVGTSAKGPQSAILSKNSLLIMIKSQKKIDNKSWAKYAQSLN